MGGAHRADSEKALIGSILRNLEDERSKILALQRDVDWNIRQMGQLGDWNDQTNNVVVIFREVVPKDFTILLNNFNLAIERLQEVKDSL